MLGHVVERWQIAGLFYKLSGTPTGFTNNASNTTTTSGTGGTFNGLTTPTSVALGAFPKGSVYKSGNNVMYFTGLTQVPDPSIALLPANLQSQSSLFSIQGPNGNLLLENPSPGMIGGLSPTNYRGLGTFTFNLTASKSVTLNSEHKVIMKFRADAIN